MVDETNIPENSNDPNKTQDAPPPTEEGSSDLPQIKALQDKVTELEAQVKEQSNKYMYLYAEFDNFKKRTQRERSDLLKFGWESAARELLQVVDNLERAMEHVPPTTDKNLVQGLEMVLNQFKGALEKQGIQKIESLEKSFDPNLHEALGQEASEQPAGTIVREHSRGYTLHGRLLRPARVVISQGNENQK